MKPIYRLAIAGLLLAAAFAVYAWFSPAPVTADKDGERSGLVRQWESAQLSVWKNWKYVSLADQATIRAVAAEAVRQSFLVQRLKLSDAQYEKWVEAVTTTYAALPSATASEYLQAIAPVRQLRDDADGVDLRVNYKLLTGQPMPGGLEISELVELFWSEQPPRPTETSLADPNGLWFAVGEWDANSPKRVLTTADNVDASWTAAAAVWANPSARGLVKITQPPETSHGNPNSPLRVLVLYTVVRNADRYVQLQVFTFWSPVLDDWVVETLAIGTDEVLLWPI